LKFNALYPPVLVLQIPGLQFWRNGHRRTYFEKKRRKNMVKKHRFIASIVAKDVADPIKPLLGLGLGLVLSAKNCMTGGFVRF
jgi:hypothetical protein